MVALWVVFYCGEVEIGSKRCSVCMIRTVHSNVRIGHAFRVCTLRTALCTVRVWFAYRIFKVCSFSYVNVSFVKEFKRIIKATFNKNPLPHEKAQAESSKRTAEDSYV